MVRKSTSLAQSAGNLKKIEQARCALRRVLDEGLQPGFHGDVSITLVIQDGTIQQVRRQVIQKEK